MIVNGLLLLQRHHVLHQGLAQRLVDAHVRLEDAVHGRQCGPLHSQIRQLVQHVHDLRRVHALRRKLTAPLVCNGRVSDLGLPARLVANRAARLHCHHDTISALTLNYATRCNSLMPCSITVYGGEPLP